MSDATSPLSQIPPSELPDARGREAVDLLHQFLAAHDEPCPACSYNLRGLTGQTCPECGEPLTLRVGLVEPRLAHFIAGLLGLAIGFGFNLLLLVWVGLMPLLGQSMPPLAEVWPLPTFGLLQGAGMWLWIRWRARIRRRPPAERAVLIAATWLLSAVGATVFFATVS